MNGADGFPNNSYMKNFILLLLLIHAAGYSQSVLRGKIVDAQTKQPLAAATIFISNSTYQTVSNEDGGFTITTPNDTFDIICSFVGYAPVRLSSDAVADRSKTYTIPMTEEIEKLKNITVMNRSQRDKYLQIFRDNLIGTTKNARKTKILNLDDVYINLDEKGNLEVTSDTPLQIENPELNYKITFVLEFLRYDFKNAVSHYSGFQTFEDLKPITVKNQKDISKNRFRAYQGSSIHFIKSAYDGTFAAEGYLIRAMTYNPNPEYPGEEAVKKLLAERQTKVYSQWTPIPQKHLMTISDTLLTQQQFIRTDNDKKYFHFDNYLYVRYQGEKEEHNYIVENKKHGLNAQVSQLKVRSNAVQLFPDGNLKNASDIIFHGYMGWEKLADMLPYDYQPPENKKSAPN